MIHDHVLLHVHVGLLELCSENHLSLPVPPPPYVEHEDHGASPDKLAHLARKPPGYLLVIWVRPSRTLHTHTAHMYSSYMTLLVYLVFSLPLRT